jgi:capsular exopolysaccharide synthesis family protein
MKKNSKELSNYPLLMDAPFQFVETFNTLRTNIYFASVNRPYRKIIVTSALPGEGKSIISINLAASLANDGKKVLLIDCDLRKHTLQKYLRINSVVPGLTTAVLGFADIGDCITHLDNINIDVIPSGQVPPNPAELLGSPKLSTMVETLSQKYDYILFDTPPVLVVTDAAVVSKLADGVVLVVKHRLTTYEAARAAKKNLENVGANIIGTVLNSYVAESDKNNTRIHYRQYQYNYK